VLEGANPSAEGEDADEGGDGGPSESVLDLADQFRYQKMEGVSKKAYQADLKSVFRPTIYIDLLLTCAEYMKALVEKMKEQGKSEEDIKAFQAEAPAAAKKILANWDNYDVYKGESMDEVSMYILVDFREDGMTPFVTVWKHGLEEYKV
jgi:Translationally controlled tumour protein